MNFLIQDLRELTSLSLVIIDAAVHPLMRIVLVPDMQAARKLTNLSLADTEFEINHILDIS